MLKLKANEIHKPVKSISGVTPIAVVLPPRKCKHGACLYCPTLNVPQSYTPKSPAIMRAMLLNYNAFKQVRARIKSFEAMNHPTDKIELIIMGGTFLDYPVKFQYKFIKDCYDALNSRRKNNISKNLDEAQKLNEKAKHRCVALCIETRPDVCDNEKIKRMREFGCTRVELGVQVTDDKIYKKVERGHTVKDVVDATHRLKNFGYKVGYHFMPGLPGSSLKKDLQMFKKIFSNQNFKPDQLKIYPCQVIKGAELENLYFKGKYKPYTKEQLKSLLIKMLKIIPRYCRVMRIMREFAPDYIIAGTTHIDLRKDIEKELREQKAKIKEIRYREIGFNLQKDKSNEKINIDLKLKITRYKASDGDEYFLEIINKDDILFGLLRLRIFDELYKQDTASDEIRLISKNSVNVNKSKKSRESVNERDKLKRMKRAFVRELHIYGQALKLRERNKLVSQHKGLGKWLMSEAEKIAQKNKIKELRVISGVGVRKYFRELWYNLDNTKGGEYMVKKI